MSVADTAALKAAIETVGSLNGHTFVTLVPAGTQTLPYVIIHPAEGEDDTDRVTAPRYTSHPEFTLHIVGASATSVQTVFGLLKTKFVVNGRPTPPSVSGRRNTRAYWRSPLPIQTDRDVTPWLVYQVVEFGWVSDPA